MMIAFSTPRAPLHAARGKCVVGRGAGGSIRALTLSWLLFYTPEDVGGRDDHSLALCWAGKVAFAVMLVAGPPWDIRRAGAGGGSTRALIACWRVAACRRSVLNSVQLVGIVMAGLPWVCCVWCGHRVVSAYVAKMTPGSGYRVSSTARGLGPGGAGAYRRKTVESNFVAAHRF